MLPAGDADEQIDGVDDSWSQEEVAKQRILHKTSRSMEEGQDVEDDVQVVSVPEGLEGVAPGVLGGEDVDDDSDQSQHESSKASHCQEEPVGELGQSVSTMVHFTEDAGQIVGPLRGDVVEVDTVTNTVHDREEQTVKSNNLVETNVRVERNVVVEDGLPEIGDEVASHCNQEDRVGEHHSRSSSTSDCHTITSDSPQTGMFSLHRVVVGPLDEDSNGDKLKEGKIENVKPVVLHPSQEDCKCSSGRSTCQCPLLNRDVKSGSGFCKLGLNVLLGAWISLGGPAVGTDDGATSTSSGCFTRAVTRRNCLTSSTLFWCLLFDLDIGNVKASHVQAC